MTAQVFFKTTFPQFFQSSISYQLEHAGTVISEGSVDFCKHYTFQRGEPVHFEVNLTGRAPGRLSGDLVFDGIPQYFQVGWQAALASPFPPGVPHGPACHPHRVVSPLRSCRVPHAARTARVARRALCEALEVKRGRGGVVYAL